MKKMIVSVYRKQVPNDSCWIEYTSKWSFIINNTIESVKNYSTKSNAKRSWKNFAKKII